MNITLVLEYKDVQKLTNILVGIDPTGIFVGALTGTIKNQLEKQMNAEVKFAAKTGVDCNEKKEEPNMPVFGAPK